MRQYFYGLFLGFLFVTGVARATVVPALNVTHVVVSNTSAMTRQAALPKALGQVLVKMSGNPAVMTLPAMQNALDHLNDFIQSYDYRYQSQRDSQGPLLLQVTFDRKALMALLRKAGQADWPRNRPLTLLWLQTKSNEQTNVLSNTNDPQISQIVLKTAKMRGVPILLPAVDLDDQALVDIKADRFNPASLKQVAKRYAAVAVFAGNVQQQETKWQGQWLFLINDTPYRWRNTADSLAELLKKAVNDVANLMANQLAIVSKKDLQTTVTLDIKNVEGLTDYAKVLSTLRHLSPVAHVVVSNMEGSDLLLQVKVLGGEQALSAALAKQQNFSAIETLDDATGKADLSYRWHGFTL